MLNLKGTSAILMLVFLPFFYGCIGFHETNEELGELETAIPADWTANSNTGEFDTNSGWLDTFNDPLLKKMIYEALENNRDLQTASARMEASFAQARVMKASQFPRFNGTLGASRNQRTSSSGFQLTNPRTTNYAANVNASWELDLWGRIRNRKEAALADFKASQSLYKSTQLSLAIRVAQAWYRATEARLQMILSQETVRNFEQTSTVIEKGYHHGINSALDVRLAKVNLSTAKSNKAAQKIRFDEAVRALEILLGRYPSGLVETMKELPEITKSVPAGIPSEILSRRPDIAAAKEALIAADERLKDKKKNFLPEINLTGRGGTTGEKLKNLLNFNFLIWSIGADFTQPIFEGGKLKAEQKLAEANRREAVAEYAQAVLVAFQEVESALSAEEFLVEQFEALLQANEDSHRAETLALENYQKGLTEILTLLDTQRRTVDIERSLIQVKNQRIQNRLALHLALGGDFEGRDSGEEE